MDLFVIAIILTVAGAQQSRMEGHQNILSIVGSKVTLKCSTPYGTCHGVKWEKRTSGTNRETIFADPPGWGFLWKTYRYKSRGYSYQYGCDLVIYDVKLTDAGLFTCTFAVSSGRVERNAYLIVLKTKPYCAINASLHDVVEGDGVQFTCQLHSISFHHVMKTKPYCAINASLHDVVEGDGVQLTCELTYNGTANASMLWKDVENATAPVENGETISRSYSVVASAPEVPSFACVTSFETRFDNDSVLNFSTTACETCVIKVLYPVRNVTLLPELSYYSPEAIITCLAKGHPPPSFKWQVQESENEAWIDIPNQNSSEFTTSSITSKWKWFRCIAMNMVRGKSYNATSQEFQFNKTDYLGVGIGIGFGIGLLVSIVLVSIVHAIMVRLGYVEFHLRQASQPSADVPQPMKHKKSPSSNQNSSIPTTEAVSESTYESLGYDRDTNAYESFELRQKPKPKKEKKVQTLDRSKTP